MDKKDEEVQGGKKGGQENTLGVLRRPPQFADPVRKEQKSMAHRLGWGRECRKASINYQKTKRFSIRFFRTANVVRRFVMNNFCVEIRVSERR